MYPNVAGWNAPPPLVPEIVSVCQLKEMGVDANGESARRSHDPFEERIRTVHQVEKRETRIQAWSRQELEERAVYPIVRIVVAARVVEPAADPGR